jgi:hypothetical protein
MKLIFKPVEGDCRPAQCGAFTVTRCTNQPTVYVRIELINDTTIKIATFPSLSGDHIGMLGDSLCSRHALILSHKWTDVIGFE